MGTIALEYREKRGTTLGRASSPSPSRCALAVAFGDFPPALAALPDDAARALARSDAGDVPEAGIVFVGERVALTVPGFAAVNVVLTGGWLAVVAALNVQIRAQTTRDGRAQL